MAAAGLNDTAAVASGLTSQRAAGIAKRASAMSKAISAAALANGTVHGRYVFEVDGFGNNNQMDDANVPSLLSLPYLGAVAKDDPAYLAMRNWVLSNANPYFWSG